MTGLLLGVLKNVGGYVIGKLLKPETAVELLLDFGDIIASRTDTDVDNKAMASVRKALGHKE
ncbi:hypothetical protein NVP1152O_014 [Vibrio phage 1.152.O._10N.222.46.E1]|uniref:Uncharacterized protein n=5 Tax=Nahantvirus 49C7 TaxID=2846601 RepID=A0A2I7RB87_9CAUD|nr:hypothetical protein HYP57_gp013 [Vibrio phage 1.026.O._10N.222.49.C7]AUR82496.1 hypothetical protein NVP1025O_013 [Vibrio phage 1.025.O._10N.222.46.B6]AUR90746.1 hypothetical protein NVP1150O_013 [Vibrio phage 1.150.O._10N.222.46.A6]AUR90919.1 hypothetical protein NVP1152O_014 [Vibrio phage 1.152.O._10N.222.46.E1]AUS02387.1 hypothetical protein NVP2130O_013 [Vibrio phage 2.130.O._10N.222.46.C2]AUR82604.1 hypothetical protein NVP1026O_013 [Vibrio phage 1.026.O._10N.222.49.C7]